MSVDAIAATRTIRWSGAICSPHQLSVASINSEPGRGYRAPIAFPMKLFSFALLVEIVPGNWEALKRIPAPFCGGGLKPLREKQFPVIVFFCAPRAGSVVLPKLVSASPLRPFRSKLFCELPPPMEGVFHDTVLALRSLEDQLTRAREAQQLETVILRFGGVYGPDVPSLTARRARRQAWAWVPDAY